MSKGVYDSIQFHTKYILKFSATGFLDPKPFADIGLEHRINNRIAVESSVGIFSVYLGLYASGLANSKRKDYIFERNLIGFRYRGSIKYYPYKVVRRRKSFPYIGAELKYNYYQHSSEQFYDRYSSAYREKMDIPIRYNSVGIDFKFGRLMYIGKHKKAIFEFYTGVGYKYTHISQNLPADVQDQERDIRLFEFGILSSDLASPVLKNIHSLDWLLGFKLGYVIK